MTKPSIYLIRHGEKPPKLPNGDDANGLSARGLSRAQGLRKVFGKESSFDIQYIIVEHPKKDGSRTRPYETILPLSQDLGIEVNSKMDRDDVKGVAKAVKEFKSKGNVLICWEHGVLGKIAEELTGGKNKIDYPGDRFDVIWEVRGGELVWTGSENIPGLDDGNHVGTRGLGEVAGTGT